MQASMTTQRSMPSSHREQDDGGRIRWRQLDNGWIKLNCDAAVVNLGEKAAMGGIVRGADGEFIMAYSSAMGGCNTLEAKLNAILMGSSLVHARGFKHVAIESDSLLAVRLIRDGCSSLHPSYEIIRDIQRRIQSIRECSIEHVLREANQVVDGLAKFGLSLINCSRTFESLSLFISLSFYADLTGTTFPRGF